MLKITGYRLPPRPQPVDPDSKEGLRRRVRAAHFTEMKLQRQIESLREIIAGQEAELRALRAAMGCPALQPNILGLTPIQTNLLRALHAAGEGGMSTRALLLAGDTTPASVKVHLHHVRRVLKSQNPLADVENEHGQGYRLNPHARRVVQDALAQSQPIESGV